MSRIEEIVEEVMGGRPIYPTVGDLVDAIARAVAEDAVAHLTEQGRQGYTLAAKRLRMRYGLEESDD